MLDIALLPHNHFDDLQCVASGRVWGGRVVGVGGMWGVWWACVGCGGRVWVWWVGVGCGGRV